MALVLFWEYGNGDLEPGNHQMDGLPVVLGESGLPEQHFQHRVDAWYQDDGCCRTPNTQGDRFTMTRPRSGFLIVRGLRQGRAKTRDIDTSKMSSADAADAVGSLRR